MWRDESRFEDFVSKWRMYTGRNPGERLNEERVVPKRWRFYSGQGNHEKEQFEFSKTCYTIWFTHNWKRESTFNKTTHF